MRRLTIKGFKTAGFLLKAAASGIESLLEETYPVLREGAKRIGLSPKDFTHIEISNKAFNEATSIKGIYPFCKITYIADHIDGFQYRIRIGWKKTDEDIVPGILYIQKVMTDGEFDLDYILSSTENPEKGCCWVSEGRRPHRIVNNIPDGWIGVEEDLPEPGKLNENTLDYQNYMCLVQVVEGKSAEARPLAFTENRRWVNGNVDMTDYVLAWQDIPKCQNEKVVLPI